MPLSLYENKTYYRYTVLANKIPVIKIHQYPQHSIILQIMKKKRYLHNQKFDAYVA